MNLRERRSVERNGWAGYLVLAALSIAGVMLLSGRISVMFVALVTTLLCAIFAAGFSLLIVDLRARAQQRRVLAVQQPR